MTAAERARQFAQISRVVEILAGHPSGVRLGELAARLAIPADALREEIRAYHADGGTLGGGYREQVIEFIADPEHGAGASASADSGFVRLVDLRPAAQAGTGCFSLGELDRACRAAWQRLAVEPDNTALAEALSALEGSVRAGIRAGETAPLAERVRVLRRAAARRRRVGISYAPGWKPGLVERVIEPYQVVHTRRGWEVDGGVVGKEGVVGTFLVAGVQSYDVLDETFERPPDMAARIDRSRRRRPVEVVVSHAALWAVEMYAESTELLAEDEQTMRLRILVLPPVAARVGLLLLAAGRDAFVVTPPALANAGRQLARDLLEHHQAGSER